MQSNDDAAASPMPRRKQQTNQQQHHQQNHTSHGHGAMSEPIVSGVGTPKSKRPPKGKQQGAKAASIAIPANGSPNDTRRAASMAGPDHGVGLTPSKLAYAGPTFHASPAASSLPVPRLFSKSMPGNNPAAGLQARMDNEEDRPSSKSGVGQTHLDVPSRDSAQSPLDLFFRADREERAKRHSRTGSEVLLVPANARPSSGVGTPEKELNGKDLFQMDFSESDSPTAKRVPKTAPPAFRRAVSEKAGVQNVTPDSERAAYTQSLKDLLKLDSQGSPTPKQYTNHPSHTPRQSVPQQSAQDLSYGNRNLSPLFQAARKDSSNRPSSSLRQQISPFPDLQPQHPSQHYPSQQAQHHPHAHPSQVHQQHYQYPPVFPQGQSPVRTAATAHHPGQRSNGSYDQGGANPGTPNVKAMEDDLRRMLKMNPA